MTKCASPRPLWLCGRRMFNAHFSGRRMSWVTLVIALKCWTVFNVISWKKCQMRKKKQKKTCHSLMGHELSKPWSKHHFASENNPALYFEVFVGRRPLVMFKPLLPKWHLPNLPTLFLLVLCSPQHCRHHRRSHHYCTPDPPHHCHHPLLLLPCP